MIKIGNVGAAGRIHAQVFKKVDGVLVPVGPEHVQDNIVTAGGLAALTPAKENILEFTSLSNVINLGEGTQAEQESVDTLADYVTRGTGTQTVVSTVDFDNFEGSGEDLRVRTYRVQHQFEPTGVDRNYTEIGLGPDGSAGGLHTYALFRDAEGNPAAITVRADEYFNVTYTYQVQAYRLRGFPRGTGSSYQGLLVKEGSAFIGPFPVGGVAAYVWLAPRVDGTRTSASYSGISYTTAPLDGWSAVDFLSLDVAVPANMPNSPRDIQAISYGTANSNAQKYAGSGGGNYVHAFHQTLSSMGFDLTRKQDLHPNIGPRVYPPGYFGNDTVYIYAWAHNKTGSFTVLTEPIKVEPDEEFTIDEYTGLAWTVNPAVNKPWIDPEG